MSISPVSYSKSGNGEVIDNGPTQETHHVHVTESWNKEIEKPNEKQSKATARRPDIDVLNIIVTWLILLYHVVIVYCPYIPYYVKDVNIPAEPGPESGYFYALVYIIFNNAWNMPLFFFLAGVSSFLSLKRRDEQEYRNERVHRLLVPTLFLMAVTQASYAFRFYAPLSPDCLAHYNHNATNETSYCLAWWGSIGNGSYFATSFGMTLLEHYFYPSPQQAWFCIYLYVYSQLLAFSFTNWHTKHGDDGPDQPTCCGRSYGRCLGLLKKPFSLVTQILCCMCICFMPSSNPRQFTDAIKKLLLGSIRILAIPGTYLAVVELSLRWAFPDGKFHAFSFLFDWCNNFHFIGIFFLGYAITSGDETGFGDILRRGRWWYFITGSILLLAFVALTILGDFFLDSITKYVLSCIFRGYGEWMFLIGLYGLNRNIWTKNFTMIKTLREMAMPFYLLHQQILILLLIGTLRIPSLASFFVTIISSTLVTCIVAFLIAKSPGPIRYFFGLPSKNKIIPGEKLYGFGPFIALVAVVICEAIAANVIRIL